MKSMTPEEKKVMKAYMHRKIRTMPLLVMAIIAILLTGMFAFQWVRANLSWHKTEATIMMVSTAQGEIYQYRYTCERDGKLYSGAVARPKLFYSIPYTPLLHEKDTMTMAYQIDHPNRHVVFCNLESRMMTWFIIFLFCFIMYFWMEYDLKKRSNIRLTG